ncbi:MAG: hypothetical protein CSA66_06260 [Proteobacteria bacterium]|nr:MAG: hypothetical protein CSA66_06260 [Pseudomonadota bacterium]
MTRPPLRWRPLALVLACFALGLSISAAVAPPEGARAASPDERDRRLLKTYRGLLADDPDQDYALRRLLEVSHAVGGLGGLIALYAEQVEAHSKDFAAWMVLGHLRRAAEADEDAVAAYAQAAALRPDSASPHLARAALDRERRRWDAALSAYDAAIALLRDREQKQDALRAAAEAAIEAERPERAEGYFDALVKTEPRNLFLRMQHAATLARLDQPARALELWQDIARRARGQLQHLVIAYKEIAELQTRMGRLEEAEETWREALAKTPSGHWERATFVEGLIAVHRRQDRLRDLVAELSAVPIKSHETLITLARLHEELAEDVEALALYRAAVAKRPSDLRSRQAALRILERVGTSEEVVAAYEALIRAAPGEPRHELRLAELQLQRGASAEGYALLDRISRRYPRDPGVHQRLVDLWMRYGDATAGRRIEAEYKALIRLEPREPGHVVSLGELYWTAGDRDAALATWRRLLTSGASKAEGCFLLAEVYADHDLAEDAVDLYRQAHDLAPDDPRFAKAYALILERTGKYRSALETWTALAAGGDGPGARARAAEARGHVISLWERARTLQRETARLEGRFAAAPPDLDAGRFLAAAYLHGRRLDDARRVLERLHALAPDDIEALLGLEQLYTRSGELELAIGALTALARVDTRAAAEHVHRAADLALTLGDEARALALARRAVELDPASATALLRVGELYGRLDRRAEAAEALRQALALDPRNTPVRFELAGLYRDLGQPIREEQILADLVREAREPGDALRAGRRLIQLGAAAGRLEQVEAILRPLAASGRSRGVYLALLVDTYANLCRAITYGPLADRERRAALRAVGERGLKPLLDALVDNDVAVRSRALEVLAQTAPSGAAPALARLTQQPDILAQIQAAEALGRIGSETAVLALARLARQGKAQTRGLAVWALGLVRSAPAAAALAGRLERATPRERGMVATALGRAAHPAALQTLEALASDRLAAARAAALWALGRVGEPAGVPALVERLRGGTGRELQIAARALGRLRAGAGAPALVAALWSRPDLPEDLVWDSLAGGGYAADDGYAEALYDKLLNRQRGLVAPPPPALFVAAPRELRRAPGGPVVARHRPLLDARVGAALRGGAAPARRLLRRLSAPGGPSLVPADRFPADTQANRAATLELLAGHREAVIALATRSRGRAGVAGAAVTALAAWSAAAPDVVAPEEVSAIAGAALASADASVLRRAALEALAKVATPQDRAAWEAVAALAAEAADGGQDAPALAADPAVRVALARTLGRLARPGAEGALVALARDELASVRFAAAAAAAGYPGPRVVGALLDLLDDPAGDVAEAAAAALGAHLEDPRARRALQDLAERGAPRIKRAAVTALGGCCG